MRSIYDGGRRGTCSQPTISTRPVSRTRRPPSKSGWLLGCNTPHERWGNLRYVEGRAKNILLGRGQARAGFDGRSGDGSPPLGARLAPRWPGPAQFSSGSRMSTARYTTLAVPASMALILTVPLVSMWKRPISNEGGTTFCAGTTGRVGPFC